MIDNILVPKHELLSSEEVEALLEKFKVTLEEIPKIKMTDPGISHLKVGVGDVIKITREAPGIGESLYYRVVVEG